MPIDWVSAVNWASVGLLSGFAFLAALISNFLLSSDNRWIGAFLAAILFAVIYIFYFHIFWAYYPH